MPRRLSAEGFLRRLPTYARATSMGIVLCCVSHFVALAATSHRDWTLILMTSMAIACLRCAAHLRRSPGLRTWVVVTAMYALMVAGHLVNYGSHAGHGAMQDMDSSGPASSLALNISLACSVGVLLISAIVVASQLVTVNAHSRLPKLLPDNIRP